MAWSGASAKRGRASISSGWKRCDSRVSTLDGPAMMRSKKASPSSARLGLRSDTRRGAGRGRASRDIEDGHVVPEQRGPALPERARERRLARLASPGEQEAPSIRTTRAPCTITASDSAIAATALYSTAVTARAALGSSTSIPAEDRTRHAGPDPLPADGLDPPGVGRDVLIVARPRLEDDRGQPPDGGIVGLEREGERPCPPADGPAGGSHAAGTIAPWRVSSSRNAATSLRASSALSAGNFSRSAAARSGRGGGSAEPVPEAAAGGIQDERAA